MLGIRASFFCVVAVLAAGCVFGAEADGAFAALAATAPGRSPSFAAISGIKASDKPQIVAKLSEAPLADKARWVWALAKLGDGATTATVYNMMTADYEGRLLMDAEETSMQRSLHALGQLASTSDSALNLLIDSSKTEYWESRKKFASPGDRDGSVYYFMTEFSIRGLGISGRPEALAELDRIRREADEYYLYIHGSTVVQAYYYFAVRRDKGEEALLRLILEGDSDSRPTWRAYTATEEYTKINEWYRSVSLNKDLETLRKKYGYAH